MTRRGNQVSKPVTSASDFCTPTRGGHDGSDFNIHPAWISAGNPHGATCTTHFAERQRVGGGTVHQSHRSSGCRCLPYIKAVVQQHGKFLPVKVATPATDVHLNPLARNVLEAEWQRQNQQGFAKFDCGPGDFTNLIQAIDMTAAVAGSYIEVGCFRGSSSCVAMRYMAEKQLSRNCFFLDVFDGFDYPEAQQSADCMWQGTHQTEGRDVVAERIQQFQRPEQGLKANVLRRDIIGDPLPDDVDQIALANIDVDLYEAVAAALPKIAERMVHRGVMIVEDPGHTPMLIGSRLALDEFMATDLGSQCISLYMESGQTFLIRD